jgi:predicted hydrolase (HD superfamily)
VTYKELKSITAPDRETALSLLKQYLKNEGLLRHALAVEAVMTHFAGLFGEDRKNGMRLTARELGLAGRES